MRKRPRTYKASADGCGAGVGRVTTTGRAPRDDGSIVSDDGSAARDDGYGSLKKIGRQRVRNTQRRIQGWPTTGVARATTAEIAQQLVARRATTAEIAR